MVAVDKLAERLVNEYLPYVRPWETWLTSFQCRGYKVEHMMGVLLADMQEAVEVTEQRLPPSVGPWGQIYIEMVSGEAHVESGRLEEIWLV